MRAHHWLFVALSLSACDAAFEDLRPTLDDPRLDAPDLGSPDLSAPDLALADLGGADAAVGLDLSAPVDASDAAGPAVLSTGSFEPLDYEISGAAQIVRQADGSLELELGDDFRSFPVPGPVVVLTDRPEIGRRIDAMAGDLRIANLRSNSGAQSYSLPEGSETSAYVFIYCEPFGLPVGRAAMSPGS